MKKLSRGVKKAVILAVNGLKPHCRGCPAPLTGRQKDWCSDACKNRHNRKARIMGEKLLKNRQAQEYIDLDAMSPADRLRELGKVVVRLGVVSGERK